eukprot:jgi/Botrbrau1/23143/Bobra.0710s0001.1
MIEHSLQQACRSFEKCALRAGFAQKPEATSDPMRLLGCLLKMQCAHLPWGLCLRQTTVIAFRLARSAIFPSSRADVNAPPTATARWTRVSNVTSLLARVAALATTIVIVCKSSVQCRSIWGKNK